MTPRLICEAAVFPALTILLAMAAARPAQAESGPLVIQGGGRTVTIGEAKLVDDNAGLYRHELSVAEGRGGKTEGHFAWIDHASSFESGVIRGDNLALIGKVETAAEVLVSLNIREHAETAFVLCRSPRISPDGSRAAYLQFKPRHETTAPMADAVLLLDLLPPKPASDSERETRQTQWVLAAQANGAIEYPSNLAGIRYTVAVGYEKLTGESYSIEGLQWSGDQRLVFVVSDGGSSLKSLHFGPQPGAPELSSVPITPELFGAGGKGHSEKLQVLNLKVMGNGSVEVSVKPESGLPLDRAVIPIPGGGSDGR